MILTLLTYLGIAGAYLIVIPALILYYMKARWYDCGSLERAFLYFLVFFFFAGILLLAPFVNFRPQKRQIEA